MHDDFDTRRTTVREATFKIGGETFTYTPQTSADLIAAYFDASSTPSSTRNAAVLEAADNLICSMLAPGHDETWRKVRARRRAEEDPLTIREVQMVADRMLEVMTDRPTESSSDSGTTPTRSGTSSTDESRSQEQTG